MEYSAKKDFLKNVQIENFEIKTCNPQVVLHDCQNVFPNTGHCANSEIDICCLNSEKNLLYHTGKEAQDISVFNKDEQMNSEVTVQESEVIAHAPVSEIISNSYNSLKQQNTVISTSSENGIQCNITEICIKERLIEFPIYSSENLKENDCKNIGISLKERADIPQNSISLQEDECKSSRKENVLDSDLNKKEHCSDETEGIVNDIKLYSTEKDVTEDKQDEMLPIKTEILSDTKTENPRTILEDIASKEETNDELIISDENKAIAFLPEVLSKSSGIVNNDAENETKFKESNICEMSPFEVKEKISKSRDEKIANTEEKLDNDPQSILKSEIELEKEKKKDFSYINNFSYLYDTPDPLYKDDIPEDNLISCNVRYDLAIEKNKRRFRLMRQQGLLKNCITIEDRKREACKPEAEKIYDYQRRERWDKAMALRVTKISIEILKLLQKNRIDQTQIAKFFSQFLELSVTPRSIVYAPIFVRTVTFCRGHRKLSIPLRTLANTCYKKFYSMFPVPFGSNFEKVYKFHVRQYSPDNSHCIENISLHNDLSDKFNMSDLEDFPQD